MVERGGNQDDVYLIISLSKLEGIWLIFLSSFCERGPGKGASQDPGSLNTLYQG